MEKKFGACLSDMDVVYLRSNLSDPNTQTYIDIEKEAIQVYYQNETKKVWKTRNEEYNDDYKMMYTHKYHLNNDGVTIENWESRFFYCVVVIIMAVVVIVRNIFFRRNSIQFYRYLLFRHHFSLSKHKQNQ